MRNKNLIIINSKILKSALKQPQHYKTKVKTSTSKLSFLHTTTLG